MDPDPDSLEILDPDSDSTIMGSQLLSPIKVLFQMPQYAI